MAEKPERQPETQGELTVDQVKEQLVELGKKRGVLTYSEITPIVFSANMTIGISWYGVALSVGHNFLTKEFDSGTNHNYASIKMAFQF